MTTYAEQSLEAFIEGTRNYWAACKAPSRGQVRRQVAADNEYKAEAPKPSRKPRKSRKAVS